jgi:Holliday junction resolvase RusA-like endonuclease
MIRIVLPGQPKGKGRPRFSRASGRTYTPEETRSYEGQLRWVATLEMRGAAPLLGALTVMVVARMSIPTSFSKKKRADALSGELRPTTKPDWDNIAKMLDGLNKIVWNDDAQIADGRLIKLYSETPSLEICVSELTEVF